jgi:hypothetical protein
MRIRYARSMQKTRVYLTAVVIASAMALLPVTAAAQAAKVEKKVDVSGKWLFSVTTDAGTGTPTVTLKQTGDSLSGHYSSQTLGEAELKGTVKDQKIGFSFAVEVQGTTITVTYSGTMETSDSMKGTVDLGGMASGTFTAKRQ